MSPKSIGSILILSVILASLLLPVANIVTAQISPGRIVEIKTAKIYPGEPVVVSIEVYMATTYTVKLCPDLACSEVWSWVSRYASVPGAYDVILTLPESLPGATDTNGDGLIDLYVVLEIWGTLADHEETVVYPKVVVTPPSTTVVVPTATSPYYAPVTVTVRFLGYLPGDTVSSINVEGPLTGTYPITPVTIGTDGTGSTSIKLLDLTGFGLPRGTYKVTGIPVATDITNVKPGSLEVRPQVIVTPFESNGRCDAAVCELTAITITGYGFDPKVRILKVEFFNINFTNVKYTFTPPTTFTTNEFGYFTKTDLKDWTPAKKGFNMTAGLYIPIVYEAPIPTTFTNTSTIELKKKGTVIISESVIVGALGTRASVSATSYVDAKLDYVLKQSRMSYVLTEVLRINISYGGKLYQLAANLVDGNVKFALYNITTVPFVTMFETTITPTYNETLGAYQADLSFNIVPTAYYPDKPPTPGAYRYWATFYSYPNQILLLLREWSLVVTKANLSVTYTNKDTGTTVSRFYEYPTNMSVTDYIIKIPTLKFTDAGIDWSVDWSYDVGTITATLKVTAAPVTGPSFEFRNVYYIVRPLLILLTPGVIYPGMTVTMAAYGYGPGAAWGYPGYNTLYVYWEKILLLDTFTLGKDGNLTFKVKIPEDATFGVHYIWGVDKWGYEYTLAIIVGAKAYWYTGKIVPEVWAGYNDKRVEVCPCPESLGVAGVKYCAQCAVYTAKCDYLGDVIKVVVAGLSPGETIRVYFGGKLMLTAKVNKSTEEVSFVVPSVPEGTYTITVVGTASGSITVTDFFNTTKLVTASPKVVPKVLILDLNKDVVPVIVGSGFVRVIGSGFPSGIAMYAVLFNGTDAAYTLNAHVTRWLADARGILTSPFTDVLGIYVPVVEPGAYAISLAYSLPDGTVKVAKAGYVFVVNNISTLLTKAELDKATATLSSKIDAVSTALSSAVALLTSKIDAAVTELRSRIDAATGTITSRIDSSTAALSSKIDAAVADLKTKIDASTADLKTAIDGVSKALSTAVTTITSKVDAVSGKVDTVSSKVDTVSSKVDAVAGTLKTVSDALSSVAKDVSAVKTSVDAIKADVADIKGVKTDVAALKTDVAGVKSDVAGLKTDLTAARSDIATVKSDVAGVKSDVAAIPGRVDGAAMASYIAVVFALLAFIMATLAFITIRKVTGAPK